MTSLKKCFSLAAYTIFFLFVVITCVPLSPTNSGSATPNTNITENGVYTNKIFVPEVKTIQLIRPNEPLLDAVIPLSQETPLLLVFDVLEMAGNKSYPEVHAKIVHCNADWRKSTLNNIEFMNDFNEFPINNISLSFNTKVPYSHYQFQVPSVKISGNYILKVYKNRNENEVLFTKRFMVYQNLIAISATINISSGVSQRNTHQQVEFTVNYNNLNIPNPADGLWVVLRQNQAWYNAIEGLKPSFIREVDKQLEYSHYNLENNFPGGSEYRYFDLRSTHFKGQNVGEILVDKSPVEAFLLQDKSRGGEAYSQYNDLNGGFIIGNAETEDNSLDADYLLTHFFVRSENPVQGQVYITGAFNNRQLTPENQMKYQPDLQGYTGTLLLKQGFYNYQYYVDTENPATTSYHFEGSHFETENQYEIFIYNRPIGMQADLLVGYTNIFHNARKRN